MKKFFVTLMMLLCLGMLAGCGDIGTPSSPSSDAVQNHQQELLSKQAVSAVGMADIHNFTEKRLMKLILEKRDMANLATYAYTFDRSTGKFRFFGNTIGYGLPYSTQYSNPERVVHSDYTESLATIPQADPNGLFSPGSAAGTWVLMKDPNSNDVEPIYMEPDVTITPFKLSPSVVETN